MLELKKALRKDIDLTFPFLLIRVTAAMPQESKKYNPCHGYDGAE
jgi:hypothetical protein